jgi:hypothetical protein
VKGERDAMEFRKRIESRYGDNRQADAERKLLRLDGSKAGDQTVTYDKSGWVFWMLMDRMGREPTLRGMKEFIAAYNGNRDHPVLHDFVEHMRRYAPDTASYDDFVASGSTPSWSRSIACITRKPWRRRLAAAGSRRRRSRTSGRADADRGRGGSR